MYKLIFFLDLFANNSLSIENWDFKKKLLVLVPPPPFITSDSLSVCSLNECSVIDIYSVIAAEIFYIKKIEYH